MVDFVKSDLVAVGVDIGGTKVAVGVVDARGRVLTKIAAPLQASAEDPEITVTQVARLVQEITDGRISGGNLAVGVGVPAVVDRGRGVVVWAPNISGWRDLPVREKLSKRLGTRLVTLDFDGNTAVLAEGWVGAGRGKQNVVFLIIGTGIGAGMILDGRVYRGSTGIPGGVGWYALDPALIGDAARNRTPSFEELCAGPGLLRSANAGVQGTGPDPPGNFPDTRALFAAYDQGDQRAALALERAVTYVGMGAANIISTLNPEVLVIGGGIGIQYCRRPDLFNRIRRLVDDLAQPAAARAVEIRPALLGADAGVVGAARLALDEFIAED
ncbi:MAG: ROK family protein [Firmicutes bacterium]|nr:ROK family protein [Bacillota bacterium]